MTALCSFSSSEMSFVFISFCCLEPMYTDPSRILCPGINGLTKLSNFTSALTLWRGGLALVLNAWGDKYGRGISARNSGMGFEVPFLEKYGPFCHLEIPSLQTSSSQQLAINSTNSVKTLTMLDKMCWNSVTGFVCRLIWRYAPS